jgi:thiamine biosynthesis protein ThiS
VLNSSITIKVTLFGYFQLMLGTTEILFTLPAPADLQLLWGKLTASYRQLQNSEDNLRAAAGMLVNGKFIPRSKWQECSLSDGDSVILVSQMGGG